MVVELNFTDLNPNIAAPEIPPSGAAMPLPNSGTGVEDWLNRIDRILQTANSLLENWVRLQGQLKPNPDMPMNNPYPVANKPIVINPNQTQTRGEPTMPFEQLIKAKVIELLSSIAKGGYGDKTIKQISEEFGELTVHNVIELLK